MIYLGIDPGQSGGIGCWVDKKTISAYSFKDLTIRDIFESFLAMKNIAGDTGLFAMIENVHSMPMQGVASSFKFGRNFGRLEGLLTGSNIPFDYVSPQKWQKELGCLSHGDKNITKSKAQRLFPHLKITHAVADALLIMEYCRRNKTER